MGTQDSLGLAEEFIARNEVSTPLMTWDESFQTWQYYQVGGQPSAILVDPSGQPMGQWFGLTQEMVTMVENF
jgi:hypothetical protein